MRVFSLFALSLALLSAGCGASKAEAPRAADVTTRAPSDSRRVVLAPSEMAVLRDEDAQQGDSLVLGRASQSSPVLLMRFTSTWHDDAKVESAFVLLSRSKGAPAAQRALAIEVSRILDPWSSADVSWGRQPRTSLPEGSMTLTPRTAEVLRVDVTPIVQAWSKRRPDDHGIALRASGDDPFGWAYALGAAEGKGPVLEVYVR